MLQAQKSLPAVAGASGSAGALATMPRPASARPAMPHRSARSACAPGHCAQRAGRALGGRKLFASGAAEAGRGGRGGNTEEEPDWEAEMSLFKQRISRPNQLATLRELEAKVSVGKVLLARDGLAIVSGLNTDAPLGTKVSFATGTAGVLLWHRSDNLSFCLVLGDPSTITEGTPVECKIKGVLQVVDDVKGPITRKDFEVFAVPAGEDMFGRAWDHIGRPLPQYDAAPSSSSSSSSTAVGAGGGAPASTAKTRPLINQQVDMKGREQINESLLTGVKGIDILTPLGRGASLLVIGPSGTGKTRLALDALQGLGASAAAAIGGVGAPAVPPPPGGPVRSVLALVGRPREEVQATLSELRASGALPNTAVVVAEEGTPLGHQFAALCCACSIGERVRDEGGHSLVVVDDIKPLTDVWEDLLNGLAGLGPALLREGLVKDDKGRDMPVAAPSDAPSSPSAASSSSSAAASPAGAAGDAAAGPAGRAPGASEAAGGGGAAESGSGGGGGSGGVLGGDDDTALVEYEGMLVSGAVAQRRGFLSTFFMRAAKMARVAGGGSMSLLPLVPGACATGVSKRVDMSKYKTLSPEQLAKLEAALRAKQLAEELASGGGSCDLATEVVEEFISIADGQVVLDRRPSGSPSPSAPGPGPAYTINPKLSITRIGTRAYYKAMEVLAPQVRLDLAQADDARRFAAGGAAATASAASGSSVDQGGGGAGLGGVEARADARARRLAALLLQEPRRPATLAEQVVALYAVQRGFVDGVAPEALPAWLAAALRHVAAAAAPAMQELGRTGIFTAEAEAAVANALRSFPGTPA